MRRCKRTNLKKLPERRKTHKQNCLPHRLNVDKVMAFLQQPIVVMTTPVVANRKQDRQHKPLLARKVCAR